MGARAVQAASNGPLSAAGLGTIRVQTTDRGHPPARLQRFTRKAHFPLLKTIDEFDFSVQKTLRPSLLGSYLGPDFVTEGRSLILYGKEGRGKTLAWGASARGGGAAKNAVSECRRRSVPRAFKMYLRAGQTIVVALYLWRLNRLPWQ